MVGKGISLGTRTWTNHNKLIISYLFFISIKKIGVWSQQKVVEMAFCYHLKKLSHMIFEDVHILKKQLLN